MKNKKKINLIVAEDDDDDFFMLQKVFGEKCPHLTLVRFKDGEELTEYLFKKKYRDLKGDRSPVILLDLNMPRKDGRGALQEIKNDPTLRVIPVIVFTTSNAETDMVRVYELGAAAYVLKPSSYPDFVSFAESFGEWLERVSLPLLD